MKLTSPEFIGFDKIPEKFTCDGAGVSPALDIAEVPDGAESLVLILDDPDAPRGTFVHWVVFNIDPMTGRINEGAAPAGSVEATNSAGRRGYIPPCPPSGTHRYFFKLFALNTTVDLPEFITADQLLHRVKKNVIDETELVGVCSRG
ncbi:MAG: YbhB/YbcL family Raf kinase inhibitor-like protein [Candidatus Geothermincolia bacterium]